MTEAITQQTGSSMFVPYSMRPVSDPYPSTSFEEEKSRKGAPSAQQDKGLVQSASVPPSEELGQWETHVAEKKERQKLTRDQKDGLRCVSWALKDSVLSKLEKDTMFRYRVQSRVFIELHWSLLSKDRKERNPLIPVVLHDGYGYAKRLTESMNDCFGIELSEEAKEKAAKELFWLFLIGGHVYVNGSPSHEA